jgi:T5orf172 domain
MSNREGYLYVLYDGFSGLSKIGCTRTTGTRQKSIMGGYGNVLANVLNAKVPDYRSAENQCHRHFQAFRKNGEWFNVQPDEVVKYIHGHLEWIELDFENPARFFQYMLFSRNGDMEKAKAALSRK